MAGTSWYGSDPHWYEPFDEQAFAAFGKHLSVELRSDWFAVGDPTTTRMACGKVVPAGALLPGFTRELKRVYWHDGVDVQGRIARVPVKIIFSPVRWFAGDDRIRDGRDFPAVYAGYFPGLEHRFADGALCLYYPRDPEQRRWTSEKRLRALLGLAADHLFFEDVFRDTGDWIAPQAAHGFPTEPGRAA